MLTSLSILHVILVLQDTFLTLILSPFGVKKSQKKESEFAALWLFGLISLLGALAGGFIAVWFANPNPVLDCGFPTQRVQQSNVAEPYATNATDHSSADYACPPHQYLEAAKKHCCEIKDETFNLTRFLVELGGLIVTGYTGTKYFCSFLLLSVKQTSIDVEKEALRLLHNRM